MFASASEVTSIHIGCSDLELKGNDEATIRPWVWIALMFAAPILGSMGFQYYTITMSRALANAESILTQLVFEHSLKVRIQGDTLDPSQETGRLFGSTSAVNTSTSSFMGRLTNLATIDLNNIIRARDLVIICKSRLLRSSEDSVRTLVSSLAYARSGDWKRSVSLCLAWLEVSSLPLLFESKIGHLALVMQCACRPLPYGHLTSYHGVHDDVHEWNPEREDEEGERHVVSRPLIFTPRKRQTTARRLLLKVSFSIENPPRMTHSKLELLNSHERDQDDKNVRMGAENE